MNVEEIRIEGQTTLTLSELLRPGLRAIFIGINPSPVSVEAGHYFQGRLGKRFWQRLRQYQIIPDLPHEAEDDHAFGQGFGFADISRRPTARADQLPRADKARGAQELAGRLAMLPDRPLIVFVYRHAHDLAAGRLSDLGFGVFALPGPYARVDQVAAQMTVLRKRIGG